MSLEFFKSLSFAPPTFLSRLQWLATEGERLSNKFKIWDGLTEPFDSLPLSEQFEVLERKEDFKSELLHLTYNCHDWKWLHDPDTLSVLVPRLHPDIVEAILHLGESLRQLDILKKKDPELTEFPVGAWRSFRNSIESLRYALSYAPTSPEPTSDTEDETDPFAELRDWVEDELKGKQRRVMELVMNGGGSCEIRNIAIDGQISWQPSYDDAINGIFKAVNPKLAKDEMPWKLIRRANKAVLAKVGE